MLVELRSGGTWLVDFSMTLLEETNRSNWKEEEFV